MRDTLVRLTVVVGLATGLLAGCGSNGAIGVDTCGKVQPCGGDIVGTWHLDAACTSSGASVPGEVCTDASVLSSVYNISGTATFGADLTYSISEVVSATITVKVPSSCLMSNGAIVTCTDFGTSQMQKENSNTSVSCAPSGSSCVCKFIVASRTTSESGMYSTAGTVFTQMPTEGPPSSTPYCVQGNTVHVITVDDTMTTSTGQSTIAGDVVGTKQ